ncbi:MAG: hypothetical protein K2R98_06030 [Gemmataceae bacterium]|nr:hypothetical protein [Gemmataceae bacterium]
MIRRSSSRSPWRRPMLVSAVLHVLGALCFWIWAEQSPPVSGLIAPALDTRIHERELDVLVMDIDVGLPGPRTSAPPAVVPTVTPPQPAPTAVVAVSSPTTGHSSPASTAGTPIGSGTSGGTSGGGSATTFFDVAAQGRSVVYVIDRSGSMGECGRLDLARRELLASLAKLPAEVRFQVIAYNRNADPLHIGGQNRLAAATPENKQQAAYLLQHLVPEGGSEHLIALKQALLLDPEVIYFLTDADDLLADQVRTLTQLNHGRAAIHTIELSMGNRDRHEMPLHVLARDNRGKYRAVDANPSLASGGR